jgi:hypothetical protein
VIVVLALSLFEAFFILPANQSCGVHRSGLLVTRTQPSDVNR